MDLSLHGNWVDLVVIIILMYFILDSYRHNFFVILIEFVSFLSSLFVGFRLYGYASSILISNFSLPNFLSKAVGFLIVVSVSEGILASLMFYFFKKIPSKIRNLKILNILKYVFGFLDGLLITAFLILLTLSFPISTIVKDSITQSKIGSYIFKKTSIFEKNLNDVFGGVIDEGLNLLTVKPGSSTSIPIQSSKDDLTISYQDEKEMVGLVNMEREKVNLNTLSINDELTKVARNYALDMWERGYFSHYSPEGEDVADRLKKAGISFEVVGENLALAPTLSIAHTGLMNSPGHRANILDPLFNQIGIGVVDNGIYGKMFVQIFMN